MGTVKAPDGMPETRLEGLIREHQVSLTRMCYLYLHDEKMAEDAVQETFFKAYRSWASYRGEASEKTWLTRIAVNTCKDMLRSSWFRHVDRRVTPDALWERADPRDPKNTELAAAVMNLPRKMREVILLYYYQGFDAREIAGLLGISQPAVSGRLKRARENLRRTLKGWDLDEED